MDSNKIIFTVFLLVAILITPFVGRTHKEEKHEKVSEEQTTSPTEEVVVSKEVLLSINQAYEKKVKAIFKAKCFDCHSTETRYPWYYKFPGFKQLMDKDIREGMEHLDMTEGFPFGGHGTPREDLEAIAETVEKNNMPPLNYKMLHWKSGLTEEEKTTILNWVQEHVNRLPPSEKEKNHEG